LRRGVRIRLKQIRVRDSAPDLQAMLQRIKRNRINALVSAGSFEDDVAVMKAITDSGADVPVLACVAAGVHRFRTAMGEAAEGVIGPSQWEHQVELEPELGPSAKAFARRMRSQGANGSCDYPAAQAYAAGLLSIEALRMVGRVDQQGMRAAFGDLRTTTLFGDFAIDRVTGKQFGHKVLLVQWHDSEKVVIHPAAHTEVGLLELPSGWQILLASLQALRLKRPENREPQDGPDQDKP